MVNFFTSFIDTIEKNQLLYDKSIQMLFCFLRDFLFKSNICSIV